MPSSHVFPAKDPQEKITYTVDWTDFLAGDTITGSPVWGVPAGVTNEAVSNTTKTASIALSGGTAGLDYDIKCTITGASGGLVGERTFTVQVRQL